MSIAAGFWLVLVAALLILRVLTEHCPPIRRAFFRQAHRLGGWLTATFATEAEDDLLGRELRLVLRRERLQADLHRVRMLLRTDEGMSATRQIGNRLAYEGLLTDLEQLACAVAELLPTESGGSWRAAQGQEIGLSRDLRVEHADRPGVVEILDVGWRS